MQVKVGYARWSNKADKDSNSLKAQLTALKAAGCVQTFSDTDSGGNAARVGWSQLKGLVEAGAVSEVVAKDSSRLGRDMAEVAGFLKVCRQAKVAITFLNDPANSVAAGDNSSVHLKLLVGLDEHYREEVRCKIADGIKAAQAAGKHRNRVPYGYQRIDGVLSPHPDQWATAQQFITLLERNRWSANQVVDQIRDVTGHRWTPSGLRNWLLSPSLRGGVGIGQSGRGVFEHVHWGRHERLISDQQYRDALQSIEGNRRHVGRGIRQRLTGLTRCHLCGYACSVQVQRKRWRYARCNEHGCPARLKAVRGPLIEEAIGRALVAQVDVWLKQVVRDELPRPVNPEVVRLEAELAALRPLVTTGKQQYAQMAAAVQTQIDGLLAVPAEDNTERLQQFLELWAQDIKAGELMAWIDDEADRVKGADGVIGHLFQAMVDTVLIDGVEKRVVEVRLKETPVLGVLLGVGEITAEGDPRLHGTVFSQLERRLQR